MKLIDLLVRELPKRGGWPDGVYSISQFRNGELCYHDGENNCSDANTGVYITQHEEGHETCWAYGVYVARNQYEAALAASQKVEWDGTGVPPVGTECEYSLNAGRTWFKCKIDYVLGTQGLIMLADVFEGGQFVGFGEYEGKLKFRPIRSEADKKRDECIVKLTNAICGEIPDTGMATAAMFAMRVYDAIAAGKIPGVKLED